MRLVQSLLRLRNVLAILVAATAIAAGIVVTSSSPSSHASPTGTRVAQTSSGVAAATTPTAPIRANLMSFSGYMYQINYVQACQEKGHLGASFWYWGPYAWYCYDYAFPVGIAYAGGMDIQAWCNRHYPGSRAIVWYNSPYGWRCNRNW